MVSTDAATGVDGGLARLSLLVATIGVALAVVVRWWSEPLPGLALAALTVCLGALVDIDLRERRLPNVIVGPMALASLLLVGSAATAAGDGARLLWAVGTGLVFSLVLLLLSLLGSVGMGDVKLAFPIGVATGWIGAAAVQAAVLATSLSGALVAGVVLARGHGRQQTLPYGPFLALGAVVGFLTGP